MTHRKMILIFVPVFLLILCGCNSVQVSLNETNSQMTSYEDIVRLNNCGGKGDAKRTATRSVATSIEGQGTISAGFREIVEGEISSKYGQKKDTTEAIELIAPPGTNMKFVLKWFENEYAGNVMVNGESGYYIYRIPISVELVASEDLGCSEQSEILPETQPSSIQQEPTFVTENGSQKLETIANENIHINDPAFLFPDLSYFPSSFSVGQIIEKTNEDIAGNTSLLTSFRQWGRITSFERFYFDPKECQSNGIKGVYIQIIFYETPDGVQQHLNYYTKGVDVHYTNEIGDQSYYYTGSEFEGCDVDVYGITFQQQNVVVRVKVRAIEETTKNEVMSSLALSISNYIDARLIETMK